MMEADPPSRQLPLNLPLPEAMGRQDFFVSPANATAVAMVDDWRDWPEGKLAIIAPPGAGKTHLASIWAAEAGAVVLHAADLAETSPFALAAWGRIVIEDAGEVAGQLAGETALLHLYNVLGEDGGRLLLTASEEPARWPLLLPDLASRLATLPVARLSPPDDELLTAVLTKQFADRQIAVQPQVVDWLVTRMDRSMAFARRLVAALDRAALAEGRAVTRPLAQGVLASLTPVDR